MKKTIKALLVFSLTVNIYSDNLHANLKKLQKELHAENSAVELLEKKMGAPNYELSYRKIEINFELFKAYWQIDNMNYMSRGELRDEKEGNKELYFTSSNSVGSKALVMGKKIINTFPSHPLLYKTYFVMGQILKEFGKFELAQKYLQIGVDKSITTDPEVIVNMMTLAELYFNDKKFESAAFYYKRLLKNETHYAINKFRYNYAFCLYNLGEYDRALRFIKFVVEKKDEGDFDLSREALKQAHIFFEATKNYDRGINYLNKYAPDRLWIFTKYLMEKDTIKPAYRSFEASMIFYKNDSAERFKQKHELLKILIENNKYSLIGNFLDQFVNEEISDENLEQLVATVGKMLVDLQKRYKDGTRIREGLVFQEMVGATLLSLKRMVKIDLKRRGKYHFMLGDVYFDLKNWKKSVEHYEKSYKNRDRSDKSLASGKIQLDSILAVLAQDESVLTQDKRFYYYKERIKKNRGDDKNLPLYTDLFADLMKNKKYDSSFKMLLEIRRDHIKQKAYYSAKFIQILNVYINKKDDLQVRKLVDVANRLNIPLSSSVKKTAFDNVSLIDFEKAQELFRSKQYLAAIKSFEKIEADPDLNDSTKSSAMYNRGLSYYYLGELKKSYEILLAWNKKNGFKDYGVFNNILAKTEEVFDFDLYERIILDLKETTCNKDLKNYKTYILKSVERDVHFSNFENVEKFLAEIKKCGLDDESYEEAVTYILTYIPLNKLNIVVKNFDRWWQNKELRKMLTIIIKTNYVSKWKYEMNSDLEKLALSLSKRLPRQDEFRLLYQSESRASTIEKRLKRMRPIKLEYPESKFQQRVVENLNRLKLADKLLQNAVALKSPYVMKPIFKEVITNYDIFISEVEGFKPPVNDNEYQKAFKQNMAELVNPLRSKVESLKGQLASLNTSNKIDSVRNFELQSVLKVYPTVPRLDSFGGGTL